MINTTLLKKRWFMLEKLHQYPPVNLEPPLGAMATDLRRFGLVNVEHCLVEYENGWAKLYYVKNEWDKVSKRSASAIIRNPEIMDRAHQRSNRVAQALAKLSAEIIDGDLQAYSDKTLMKSYKELLALQRELHLIRSIGWIIETPGELLSNYLLKYLAKIIKTNQIKADPVLVFSILITPVKQAIADREHHELLELARKIKLHRIKLSSSDPAIKKHVKKYCFLPYGCEGPALTEADIVSQIREILTINKNLNRSIKESKEKFKRIKIQQKKWLNALMLDRKHAHLIQVAQDIVFQKGWSKEHQYLGWYALSAVLTEVARRLYITLGQARYFLPTEIPDAIYRREYDAEELNSRRQYSMLYVDSKSSYFITNINAEKVKRAMNIVSEKTLIDKSIKTLKGQTAVVGRAVGKVVTINSSAQMVKMKNGNILVSEMTIPEIVSAMKKAAAIITDAGGITCHAAIVSRELGIPCVVGTKIATRVLKDGDRVEVDATNGVVRKL